MQLEQGRVHGKIVQGVGDRGEGGEGGLSLVGGEKGQGMGWINRSRKSTRLNSSHL